MRIDPSDSGLLDRLLAPLAPARSLVPAGSPAVPVATGEPAREVPRPPWPLGDLVEPFNPHRLSPREMSEKSLDLYAAGALSFEEYSLLAFQPELHPAFDATIGALTGETAAPDRRRDFVADWEDRLAFARRYNPEDSPRVARTERIVQVLRRLGGASMDLVA